MQHQLFKSPTINDFPVLVQTKIQPTQDVLPTVKKNVFLANSIIGGAQAIDLPIS